MKRIVSLFLIVFISLIYLSSNAKDSKSDLQWFNERGIKSTEWNDLVVSGLEAYDSGIRATGYILLKKAFDKGCRDPLVLLKMGLYEEERGNYRNAVIYFVNSANDFKKYYPQHSELKQINIHTARAAFMANDYVTALDYANRAINDGTEDVSTLLIAAQINGYNKNWENAVALLQKTKQILMKMPESPERNAQLVSTIRFLISALISAKDTANAEIAVNELLYLIPNDPSAKQFKEQLERAKQKKTEDDILKDIIQ